MRYLNIPLLLFLVNACLSDVDLDRYDAPPTSPGLLPATGLPPSPEEPATAGLTMKFLDVKGNEINTALYSGTLRNHSITVKFGMLFDIQVKFLDDKEDAVVGSDVSINASNATLKQWGSSDDTLTARTNADGIASFTSLYLIDAKNPDVKLTATTSNAAPVSLEINTDNSTPDCYATMNKNVHSNMTTTGQAEFDACGQKKISTATNKHVDVPSSCTNTIGDMDMWLHLNLYKGTSRKVWSTNEYYHGNYNGNYGDCAVVEMSMRHRKDNQDSHTDTAINLFDNTCIVSELRVDFAPLSLVVYDDQTGNGDCL
ncbi:MAG: hypothetical protein OYH77_04920 [Pseudomonadota bacterium]|nr:hypothetical protein [Pseudomonadota bacterium]